MLDFDYARSISCVLWLSFLCRKVNQNDGSYCVPLAPQASPFTVSVASTPLWEKQRNSALSSFLFRDYYWCSDSRPSIYSGDDSIYSNNSFFSSLILLPVLSGPCVPWRASQLYFYALCFISSRCLDTQAECWSFQRERVPYFDAAFRTRFLIVCRWCSACCSFSLFLCADEFLFTELLPAVYSVSVKNDHWCWKQDPQEVKVPFFMISYSVIWLLCCFSWNTGILLPSVLTSLDSWRSLKPIMPISLCQLNTRNILPLKFYLFS